MTSTAGVTVREHSNSYNIFILVLTLLSLGIMAVLVLPLAPAVEETLRFYDNLICIIFLGDFVYNLSGSKPRRAYFIDRRGWLDLLGSVPSLGFFRFTALLRLFRLSRLARIARLLGGQNKKALIQDVVRNRGQYALFITLLLIMLVLSISSVLILQFESASPDAKIVTGGDALWWAVVTITTVGYGDFFPVTTLGRLTAVTVMFAGIGIIGALASILASLLVSPSSGSSGEATDAGQASGGAAAPGPTLSAGGESPGIQEQLALTRAELALARAEMAELRRRVAEGGAADGGAGPPNVS